MQNLNTIELLERISELREQLIYALNYIDALPSDIVLPAMPGLDRDWMNESLEHSKALLCNHLIVVITDDVRDFLAEFNENQFPQQSSPWIGYDDHDPAFLVKELRSFNKQGLIELDHENRRYCLTIKACNTLAVMHAETSSHPAMS